MSLGIVFKGPEGIVLAADSRVTLTGQRENMLLPASFDNATKLLRIRTQNFVGVVTYGLGAIGAGQPRTAHSFMPEFERNFETAPRVGVTEQGTRLAMQELAPRLGVGEFASRLSEFFMAQWRTLMPAQYNDVPMFFLVGGYDVDASYGKVF